MQDNDISTEVLINLLRLCATSDHRGCAGGDCKFGENYPLNYICRDELMEAAADRLEIINTKFNEIIKQQIKETKERIDELANEICLEKILLQIKNGTIL